MLPRTTKARHDTPWRAFVCQLSATSLPEARAVLEVLEVQGAQEAPGELQVGPVAPWAVPAAPGSRKDQRLPAGHPCLA